MLMSNASAEQCVIDSVTTYPDPPQYKLDNGPYPGHCSAIFAVTIHISNFPANGKLYRYVPVLGSYWPETIDDNGYCTFTESIDGRYENSQITFHEPNYIGIYVTDANNNKVATYGKTIYIAYPNTSIPEFPSIALPVAAVLGLVMIFGRRKT
jgi:hypothetical protein